MIRSRIRQLISSVYNSRFKTYWKKLPRPLRRLASRGIYWLTPEGEPHEAVPRVYPTLQCNLRCPYCADGEDYDKSHCGYKPLTTQRWIEILDALPGSSLIFTGGEPTLRLDLPEIINAIHQTDIRIYTNLTYDVAKFYDRLTKPVRIYASYHPNNRAASAQRVIANLKLAGRHPMVREVINVHMIAHPSNGNVDEHVEAFASAGLKLQVHQDMFEFNFNGPESCRATGQLRTVECKYDRILIGPDGKRWICVSKMIRNSLDGVMPMDAKLPRLICEEFGRCAPCDEVAEVKFLQQPQTQPVGAPADTRG